MKTRTSARNRGVMVKPNRIMCRRCDSSTVDPKKAGWRQLPNLHITGKKPGWVCSDCSKQLETCCRADGIGWIRIGLYDTPKRRSLWARRINVGIEICAGREGDDAHAVLKPEDPAYDVISCQLWAVEMEPDHE